MGRRREDRFGESEGFEEVSSRFEPVLLEEYPELPQSIETFLLFFFFYFLCLCILFLLVRRVEGEESDAAGRDKKGNLRTEEGILGMSEHFDWEEPEDVCFCFCSPLASPELQMSMDSSDL